MSAMTEKCFDIGEIQAFLDGELNDRLLENVARHVSVCNDCARLLAEAESESALAFAALETELDSLVPTTRIRTNLYQAIAAEKKPFWKKVFGETFRFTNPAMAAFAGLVLVVGIFTTFFIVRENRVLDNGELAKSEKPKSVETQKSSERNKIGADSESSAGVRSQPIVAPQIEKATAKPTSENRTVTRKTNYRIRKTQGKSQTADDVNDSVDSDLQPSKNQGLIGEENYIKTIATLSKTVNSRKDEILRPSARVSFEKDLAVVNDSIAKMQKEVRRDPKNEAARELLRSSYQNKIDLLNSVAEKSELMATLR